jgi:hypothetical protein
MQLAHPLTTCSTTAPHRALRIIRCIFRGVLIALPVSAAACGCRDAVPSCSKREAAKQDFEAHVALERAHQAAAGQPAAAEAARFRRVDAL